ncbi:Bax inhibitor-1/YccA family protein [Geopsychrobacter electrodiphilus]|uniref:Bax inhibitor-1/YccA family protein n=1 Tax=Geopsychrobacter electrodiphilus TaxID=225196 RepID=UPI00037A3BDE|nr:Bax inhibitor-1/YccA family protein [Geopsychrobacter electrodiphilus]
MLNDRQTFSHASGIVGVSTFLPKVYGWMTAGLGLTALAATMTLSSPALLNLIFGNKLAFYALIFGELGLVIGLSAAINRISATTATLMFLLYSALSGVTFASIFLIYTRSSIASTFVIAAGTFGAVSLYGYVTKRDLSGWGSFFFMGLIGIIIASVVNIFMQSAMLTWVISYIGVGVFIGLTAYDTQKIKRIGAAGFADAESSKKASILGALTLYLDFINLFLMMLRIMGNRR